MAYDYGAMNFSFYAGYMRIREGLNISENFGWNHSAQNQAVDNNFISETSQLTQQMLPLTPPGSCPVTPTAVYDSNVELRELDYGQSFMTDAPELEHYLRQTNPLQSIVSKRKCAPNGNSNCNNKRKRLKNHSSNDSDDFSAPQNQRTIKWTACDNEEWHKLFESSLQLRKPFLHVTCDKGLTFSPAESVFICQKKNHFQISLNLEMVSENSNLVEVSDGLHEVVNCFKVHLYAVKAESPHKKITMEQSTADRSKRPYSPVRFQNGAQTKTLTIGRLHFSETTSNNMRKKGKLNPDQRYFQLIVDLRAYTNEGNYSVCRQVSERVIVRASNPGQFENDVALWSKDKSGESVFRMGHVGINTEKPDEYLTVNGNMKLTGEILTPSDVRLIENRLQADTRENLSNVSSLQLYRYNYSRHYKQHAGLSADESTEALGVIGSEVRNVIPDAVAEGADVVLPDGKLLKDVLMINKDRLLMESLGAIQELSKIMNILTTRMVELETKNEILEVILKNMVSESMT